jgi:Flp pilus assembly protein TadG
MAEQPHGVAERRHELGAAAVELALVLPLIAILLFGIIQFSITFNQQQGLHAAAREGARYASLPSSTRGDIESRALSALAGTTLSGPPTVSITPAAAIPCAGRKGQPVVVEVTRAERISIPLVMDRTVNLAGRGEFRCE